MPETKPMRKMTPVDIITVTDIVWDTDGEDIEGLPDSFTIEVDAGLSDQEIADEVYEAFDDFDWCVETYRWERNRSEDDAA